MVHIDQCQPQWKCMFLVWTNNTAVWLQLFVALFTTPCTLYTVYVIYTYTSVTFYIHIHTWNLRESIQIHKQSTNTPICMLVNTHCRIHACAWTTCSGNPFFSYSMDRVGICCIKEITTCHIVTTFIEVRTHNLVMWLKHVVWPTTCSILLSETLVLLKLHQFISKFRERRNQLVLDKSSNYVAPMHLLRNAA